MFSKVKTRERKLARKLRREEGASIKDIALRVGVSVSSVSLWVRDIELTAEQHAALAARNVAYNRQMTDVDDDAIRLTCNLFADHLVRQHEIEQFWLDVAGLSRSCLRKSSVNVYSKYSQKKRQNKLPYGTCRICVCRTCDADRLRRHPGARRFYAGGVAGIASSCRRARKNVTTAS